MFIAKVMKIPSKSSIAPMHPSVKEAMTTATTRVAASTNVVSPTTARGLAKRAKRTKDDDDDDDDDDDVSGIMRQRVELCASNSSIANAPERLRLKIVQQHHEYMLFPKYVLLYLMHLSIHGM
jgi:hypothetical protein